MSPLNEAFPTTGYMNCPTLSYQDILSCSTHLPASDHADFNYQVAEHKQWGKIEERNLIADHFALFEYQTALTDTFRIRYEQEQMLECINVCMALQGDISVEMKNSNFKAGLSAHQHHTLFAPEPEYDVMFGKRSRVIHLTIAKNYYVDLLCEKEKWSASLKENILKNNLTFKGDVYLDVTMQQIIQCMMNNPLKGNLRSLLLEAKLLELISLQLNQFSAVKEETRSFRSTDREVLHEVKEYLETSFHEAMSMKMLSRKFAINEFKLKKGFKELFHSTVFDYIFELRMREAYQLLLAKKMFVNEVAGCVGYKNPNHFSTAFKRRFGISPAMLR